MPPMAQQQQQPAQVQPRGRKLRAEAAGRRQQTQQQAHRLSHSRVSSKPSLCQSWSMKRSMVPRANGSEPFSKFWWTVLVRSTPS